MKFTVSLSRILEDFSRRENDLDSVVSHRLGKIMTTFMSPDTAVTDLD